MEPTTKQLCELHALIKNGQVGRYALQEFIHNAPLIGAKRGLRESTGFARKAIEKQRDLFPKCQAWLRLAEVTHDGKDINNAQDAATTICASGKFGRASGLSLVAAAFAKERYPFVARDIAKYIETCGGQEFDLTYRYVAYAMIACETKENRDLKIAQAGLLHATLTEIRDKLLEEISVALASFGKGDAGRETARSITNPPHKAFAFARMLEIERHEEDDGEITAAAKLMATRPDGDSDLFFLARKVANAKYPGITEKIAHHIKHPGLIVQTRAYAAPKWKKLGLDKICSQSLLATIGRAKELLSGESPNETYNFGSAWCAIAKATMGGDEGESQTIGALHELSKLSANDCKVGKLYNALLAEFTELRAIKHDYEEAFATAAKITCPHKQAEAYISIARVCSEFIAGADKEPTY